MKDILVFAKEILLERMEKNGTFVDFTMGNGHDTLYFAKYLEEGHVYAFDVQQMALDNTRKLLEQLRGSGADILICTKSDLVVRDIDLLKELFCFRNGSALTKNIGNHFKRGEIALVWFRGVINRISREIQTGHT